jgi:hypothetical protein
MERKSSYLVVLQTKIQFKVFSALLSRKREKSILAEEFSIEI